MHLRLVLRQQLNISARGEVLLKAKHNLRWSCWGSKNKHLHDSPFSSSSLKSRKKLLKQLQMLLPSSRAHPSWTTVLCHSWRACHCAALGDFFNDDFFLFFNLTLNKLSATPRVCWQDHVCMCFEHSFHKTKQMKAFSFVPLLKKLKTRGHVTLKLDQTQKDQLKDPLFRWPNNRDHEDPWDNMADVRTGRGSLREVIRNHVQKYVRVLRIVAETFDESTIFVWGNLILVLVRQLSGCSRLGTKNCSGFYVSLLYTSE